MRDPSAVINFGKHRGKLVSDPKVPDKYVLYLCSQPSMKSPTNSFEVIWKCPGKLWAAAMAEADRRGYEPEGERWKRKGEMSYED